MRLLNNIDLWKCFLEANSMINQLIFGA